LILDPVSTFLGRLTNNPYSSPPPLLFLSSSTYSCG